MKKNVLALSIATMVGGLGFAGAASAALSVNDSGAGHILITPYYTAQNGNMSVFHITNTDLVNGKAVKVRFRGASNSDDVLDFQVFLSPGDVWTASVAKNANTGVAELTTYDNSCTLPAIKPGVPVPFVTDRLAHSTWDTAAKKAEQTLEGYVEILTMADIKKLTPIATPTTADDSLYTAIKHVNGVAPCTSTILNKTLGLAATVGTVAEAYKIGAATYSTENDLVATTTTPALTGQWYVVNVEQTTTFSGEMAAIVADTTPLNVFSPQKNGAATLASADPLLVTNLIAPQFYDVPDLSTAYEGTAGTQARNAAGVAAAAVQANSLTNSLLKTSVINQFASDAGINAKTDWVFSMPTRRYAIAANYNATTTATKNDLHLVSELTAVAPAVPAVTLAAAGYRVVNQAVNTSIFGAPGTNFGTTAGAVATTAKAGGLTSVNAAGQICVTTEETKFWDREETTSGAIADQPVFSPGTPSKPASFDLCGEVSVLAFSADESALGAKLSRQNVDAKYTNGWGVVDFWKDETVPVAEKNKVPMLGAAFVKLSNPKAREGVSGTYGLTWTHAFTK